MTEKEYRALPRKSYSMLKDFMTDRRAYHKKYILKEEVKKEITKPMLIGSLSDCLLFEPQNLEELFFVGEATKTPTGKGLDFVNQLFLLNTENPEWEFFLRAEEAYKRADLSTPKFPKYMENFVSSDLETHYQHLLESQGKTVISLQDMTNAEKVVNQLKFGESTKAIFAMEGLGQLVIIFEYYGVLFKAKVDWLGIDHKKKMLYPYDLKVVGQVEDFVWKYTKDYYYIQEGLYTEAIKQWRDEFYPDYKIDKFRFVVADNIGYTFPLIFDLVPSQGDLLKGFTNKYGKEFKGINQIIEEIEEHTELGVWTNSLTDIKSNGLRVETI